MDVMTKSMYAQLWQNSGSAATIMGKETTSFEEDLILDPRQFSSMQGTPLQLLLGGLDRNRDPFLRNMTIVLLCEKHTKD